MSKNGTYIECVLRRKIWASTNVCHRRGHSKLTAFSVLTICPLWHTLKPKLPNRFLKTCSTTTCVQKDFFVLCSVKQPITRSYIETDRTILVTSVLTFEYIFQRKSWQQSFDERKRCWMVPVSRGFIYNELQFWKSTNGVFILRTGIANMRCV